MKKLTLCLTLILTLTALASCQGADDAASTELPTESGSFTVSEAETRPETPTEDFTYTVSDEAKKEIYITAYKGEAEDVVVPATIDGMAVVGIAFAEGDTAEDGTADGIKGAFEGSSIRSVYLPDGVRSIRSCAFKDCTALTQVTLGKNTAMGLIMEEAFYGCTALERMDLSHAEALFEIAGAAFKDCTGLKTIDLPDNVAMIGWQAFAGCTSLERIRLPKQLQTMEKEAFWDCTSLTEVTIPAELDMTTFDGVRFSNNPSLSRIVLEEGRKTVTGHAFFKLNSTVEIIVPADVTTFSMDVFFVYGANATDCAATFTFLGNCPEIVDNSDFNFPEGPNITINYYSNTTGWNACVWNGLYNLISLE